MKTLEADTEVKTAQLLYCILEVIRPHVSLWTFYIPQENKHMQLDWMENRHIQQTFLYSF